MAITEMFRDFLQNLKIDNSDKISNRYDEITVSLNKKFRDTESKKANSLQVGSYGRWTAIKGISDLDMLYIMPKGKWDYYKDGKQSQLLSDVRDAIKARYPTTDVRVDRLVVTVTYTNFHIEVQPVFEQDDGSFKYPDTYNGGSWKITKPREEIAAMTEFSREKNNNLRNLCRMARAWKNKHGVGMGGLLIDTLAHNFLKSTDYYDDKGFLYYDYMSRDFFEYLSKLPKQDRFAALGSGQHVKVKKQFQRKAKKAYELCLKAIDAGDASHEKWKKVYGRPFPVAATVTKAVAEALESRSTWRNTEQFIEDLFPIDIRYPLSLDCEVSQRGYREHFLTDMLAHKIPLLVNKKLLFTVSDIQVPEPYQLKWKVLNRGAEAQKRDCIRGQVFDDDGYKRRNESTSFKGEHIVECYAIKNGIVVAKDRIHVPIQ
ncbi:nucleotidyltransferase [Vibrio vulnificus]|uniref:nucleotide-binding domain-containing protein n=1 Tax=Vibrio TaxID=662 RepID=UPI000218FDCF|nr:MULTISPECIES: nucleotidyltransferase [Vibrio]EGR0264513.1 nucleotidyltransferase [Vibrio cholerae]EGR0789194.1 nucleotidyltransferase [Vibrio vulnificus]EGR0798448.1 nucleotidyltransferase [Vibrio vulnificus]EGR0815577.1 nucleotidyltransferase [Vibrio vulnificus]EGR0827938.1 nucleotidyltransferase [Vibrio vulnificus]